MYKINFHEKGEKDGQHLTKPHLPLFPTHHKFSSVFNHFPTFFYQMDPDNYVWMLMLGV